METKMDKNDYTPWQEREINPSTRVKLCQMYKTGSYSQAALGRMFKITRQRVNQIINKYEESNK